MKTSFVYLLFSFILLFSSAYTTVGEGASPNANNNITNVSWYGDKFHGRYTASGEIYNMNELTAAHKKLPFGTKVKITNIKNGKEVTVRVNDRGPFVKDRMFDLSKAAFSKIADLQRGTAQVRYEIL